MVLITAFVLSYVVSLILRHRVGLRVRRGEMRVDRGAAWGVALRAPPVLVVILLLIVRAVTEGSPGSVPVLLASVALFVGPQLLLGVALIRGYRDPTRFALGCGVVVAAPFAVIALQFVNADRGVALGWIIGIVVALVLAAAGADLFLRNIGDVFTDPPLGAASDDRRPAQD